MTSCLVSISTSLFISTNLGSLATDDTTYVLIGLTVLMNAKELIHVLVAYRAGNIVFCESSKVILCLKTGKTKEAGEGFTSLMLGQVMEIVLPIR